MMKESTKKYLTYAGFIAIPLAVGGISALVNAGKMNDPALIQPPLSPPAWLFPIVWTILFLLMGISAARVCRSECPGKSDALFLWGVQLAVNFLWTVFYFTFQALALSFFWLLFLILLVLLMAVRFERCARGSGKLQIPYLLWLGFAAYLNLATWLLNL
jgi:tryptophan-rich sensory protein